MEPAEVHGVTGGNWTDQETLLLLEALELYKENRNEIADHVATKTKAQCILHFVQMPIEDSFLDSEDDADATPEENGETASINDDPSISKEAPEPAEIKGSPEESKALTSSCENVEPEAASTPKVEEKRATQDAKNLMVDKEILKPETASEVKVTGEGEENCAVNALREAFEALGYFSTPESPLSFAEVGNPVMAVAGFLARLAGSDVVTASARSPLKSLTFDSPGMQLALKYCFILEDPPYQKEDQGGSQSVVCETVNMDAKKDDMEERNAREDNHNRNDPASKEDTAATKESDSTTKAASQSSRKEPVSCELPKDQDPEEGGKRMKTPNPSGGKKSVEVANDSPSAVKISKPVKANSDGNPARSTRASKNEDEGSKSLLTDNDETQHPVISVEDVPDNSTVQNGATAGDKEKDANKVKCDAADEKDDHNIDIVKCAATSTLLEAAVKAKLFADHEEEQIRRLSVFLIEKQLHKLEAKLVFFDDIENMTRRVKEQLDRWRQRLYHERAQLIASRLGIPSSSSRIPPPMPPSRPMNLAGLASRAPTSMPPLRPALAMPLGSLPSAP